MSTPPKQRWEHIPWSDMRTGERIRLTHTESGDVFHGEAREGNGCMVVYGRLDVTFEDYWDHVEAWRTDPDCQDTLDVGQGGRLQCEGHHGHLGRHHADGWTWVSGADDDARYEGVTAEATS